MLRRLLASSALVLVATVAVVACGDDDDGGEDTSARVEAISASVSAGEVTEDGADLYAKNCASCHGGDGQGGIGPQLAGVVADNLTVEEHVTVVMNGRATMPSFASSLTDDEAAAIVLYERTDLGQ